MASCKDCVHVDVCEDITRHKLSPSRAEKILPILREHGKTCELFKDRSRFVELPVKISDKYYMDIKQAKTVSNMLLTISQNFEYNGDNSSAFKSYFIGVGDAIESCLKVLTPFWKEKK